MWLTNLVENLLYSTRIEGHDAENLSRAGFTVIEEAIHIPPQCKKHSHHFELWDDLLMVRADAKLIVQVIINLWTMH